MKSILIALAILLSFGTFAQKLEPINSAEIIKQAVALHDSGQYQKAIELYNLIDRNDTNYVRSLYERALTLERDSQYNRALQYCQEALSLPYQRELEPQIYSEYGDLLDDLHRTDEAIAIFNQGIAKFPSYAGLYYNKGIVYMGQEKYPDAESLFKQSLLIDPYYFSSHFYLGLVAIRQGKIVQGMISLIGYLLVNPEGKYHSRAIAILDLIANAKDEILTYKDKRTEEPEPEFSNMEDIILSKIALEAKYKPLLSLDDHISRQIQVLFEKMEFKADSKDFWLQYYFPFFKSSFDNGKFEVLINWIFEGVDVKMIQDYNRKNKKAIEDFKNEAGTYFNLIRSTRELQADKRNASGPVYLIDNGELVGKGKIDPKGNPLGAWELYFAPGNISGNGQFDEAGKRTGEWNFYFRTGKPKSIEHYKNGKLDGEYIEYSSNGNLRIRDHFDAGKLNGNYQINYWIGTPLKSASYVQDDLDGTETEYYSNGSVSSQTTYSKGKIQGPYTEYFKSGAIKTKVNFENGAAEGLYQIFFENGMVSSEGQIKKGQLEGEWKYYYPSGKPKAKRNFSGGKIDGLEEEYFEEGGISSKYSYKKAKLDGPAELFDRDGKPYSEMDYSRDIIQKASYLRKDGSVVGQGERRSEGWEHDLFTAEGIRSVHQGYNKNGLLTGTKTIYYPSGSVNQTSEYVDGNLNGLVKTYYRNGRLRMQETFQDGKSNGYFVDYYSNGKIQSEGWMRNDQAEGDWAYYDELGNLSSKAYFLDGENTGYKTEYFPNGKKSLETHYYNGWIIDITQYDSTGKWLITDSFPQGSGKYQLLYSSGAKMIEATMKLGGFDGPYTSYYFDGSIESKSTYKNGIQEGPYLYFYYGGKKSTEGLYHAGQKAGIWKTYDEDGKQTGLIEYDKDGVHHREVYYHANGNKDFEIPFNDEGRDGLAIKYDPSGVGSYAVRYQDDLAVAYTYMNKDGKWLPEIKLPGGTGAVHCYFANGNPSRYCSFKDGRINGTDTLFFANGKPRYTDYNEFNINEGKKINYNEAGLVKSEFPVSTDNSHGIATEYFDNGKVAKQTPYYNGLIHGIQKIYDEKGNLKESRYYYYGKIQAVKK